MFAFFLVFVALARLYREMFKQPETRALVVVAGGVMLLGVAFYTQVEKWSWLDAFYFCIVTLGTVGYGDMTPKTDLGKLFTTFYIIVGLGVIGGFFAAAAKLFQPTEILSKQMKLTKKEKEESQIREQKE
jgi:hypothetical protein